MVRILCRGRLLAALAITIGSIIAVWTSATAATLTVGKAAPNADPIIPVNVGDKLGIFKKHGLDLTIVDFTGGSKMTQAMVAGSIDIGVGAGTEMALVAKGAPMTAICETAGPPSFLSIGVPWDSPIRSLDRLKGKRIGVSTPNSLTDWLAKDLARKKRWGPQATHRHHRDGHGAIVLSAVALAALAPIAACADDDFYNGRQIAWI